MNHHRPLLTVFSILLFFSLHAQNGRMVNEKCGTVQRLNQRLEQSAVLRAKFEQKKIEFSKVASIRSKNKTARLTAPVYIPVVFHIVMNNPNLVTDAQIQAQLDTLNKDFFGTNGDSVKIPSYFKPLFGKSNIQFCLAQRTPDGDVTNGIERVVRSKGSFTINDDVKHTSTGGIESWNTSKYYNIWVCPLSGGLLGYSTLPNDPTTADEDQGVVIEYRSLPGGSFTNFNSGKTLTHETGHYFNLYHIWGNNDFGCADSDEVDDTPNQDGATAGCPSGVKTDNCTNSGDGIMYQNYMDYSDDPCLVMFTPGQVDRMETALSLYRSSLLSSNGCQPVVLNTYDAQLRTLNQPSQRICSASFTPQITIKNRGAQTLTSLLISVKIDNVLVSSFPWTGSLNTSGTAVVTLGNLMTTTGTHTLTIYVSNPNNTSDEDQSNDTLQISYHYDTPVTSVSESFEGAVFPPSGWDLVNPDNDITWQRVYTASKTGNASVRMDNYNYGINAIGQTDDLRMPLTTIPAGVDSAFLSFQTASAVMTPFSVQNNNWDTLEVLISTDCGQTYTSLYKKWGLDLVTDPIPVNAEFIPASNQWRKDSINLADYIGAGDLLIAFRNTTGAENQVYLDDINFRTVTVNPNLKAQGFLVTPNPTNGAISVQFYPQPNNLRAVQLFNDIGQKIAEVQVAQGQANNRYDFDLSRYAKGMYIVRAVFTDRVLTKKIIRH